MSIDKMSIEELLFDRQESFNDVVSCLVAGHTGLTKYNSRLQKNLEIIEIIRIECQRRGFDPAQFDQVMKAKNEV